MCNWPKYVISDCVCVDGFVKVYINTEEHMVTILCAFLVPQIKFLELNCLC